jgi:hypothetical protein
MPETQSASLPDPHAAGGAIPVKGSGASARAWPWDLLALLLLAAVFAALLAWTWGRWLDPIVDFGRELYIPWQLAQGRFFHTDLITPYGPLSYLVNGFLFRLFGSSLVTSVVINCTVLAVSTAALYVLMRDAGSRLASVVACLVFLAIFGFGHLIIIGNFNFITPYSTQATFGFALGLLGLLCIGAYLRRASTFRVLAMGLCLGLAFLTKPEMFVPIAGAILVMGVLLFGPSRRWRTSISFFGILLSGFAIPMVAVLLWMMTRLTPHDAFIETLGAWAYLGNPQIAHMSFYTHSAGLDYPWESLQRMGVVGLFFAALLLPGFVASLFWRERSSKQRAIGWMIGCLLALAMIGVMGSWAWVDSGRVMLPGLLILGIVQMIRFFGCLKKQPDERTRAALIMRLVLIAFGLLIMLKMLLYPRFQHYGFVLGAMPAAILVVAVVAWVPAWLQRRGRSGALFAGSSLTVLAVMTWIHLGVSGRCMAEKTFETGSGADAFLADSRGPIIDEMVDYIRKNTSPDQTLTVMPEGVILNYLARRRNPLPNSAFVPSEFILFGDEMLLNSLQSKRPDYVAIVSRFTDDLGPARFGSDYATSMREWINQHYSPVHLSGAMPFSSGAFGILLLRRNDLAIAGPPWSLPSQVTPAAH